MVPTVLGRVVDLPQRHDMAAQLAPSISAGKEQANAATDLQRGLQRCDP
jgi:hypothetical protein